MKIKSIILTVLFCSIFAASSFTQIDEYSAEEATYITNLNISQKGILFSDNYGSAIYAIKNSVADKIVSGPGTGRYFRVSPDGNWIGYKNIELSNSQQAVIKNIQNGQSKALNKPAKLCGTPTFSENETLAYTVEDYLYYGDNLSFYLGFHVNYLSISPDGKLIAFSDINESINIFNTETKDIQIVSEIGKAAFYPKWSPQNDKLLYSLGQDIIVYEINSSTTYTIQNAISASWFDNENILFQRNSADLEKLVFYGSEILYSDYTGSNIHILTNTPNRCEMNPISDGEYIYFHTYTDKQIIRASFNLTSGISNESVIFTQSGQLPVTFYSVDTEKDRSIVYIGPTPYVHQKYDTPSWHNGGGSCAPTTCVMALAHYNILPPWEVSVDHGYSFDPHTNEYGSYVADRYRYNEFYYEIYEAAYGTDAWGGYGYMWDGDYGPGSRQRSYLEKHFLTSNQLWLSSCTFNNTVAEIDLNYVHPICSWISSAGHLTLAIGYVEAQHTLIFNDPYGNKNTPSWPSYDGADSYYDWPGYNNGYQNLDGDDSHGGVAWTTWARGQEIEYNDTIIDNTYYNHGFYVNNSQEGSHQRYFHDTNAGYNNHFWWTMTMDDTNDWCWVTWTPTLSESGDYEVFAYIPEVNADSQDTKYIVTHDDGVDEVLIDQSAFSGQWASLGIFAFSPGNNGNIYVGDNTGIADEYIAFDAMKWSKIPVELAITTTSVTCNDMANATATVTPTDDNPPYEYLWSTSPAQTDATATGLSGGTYSVTVTNGLSEIMTASCTIFEPEELQVNSTAIDPAIAGFSTGEIHLSVNGGVSPYSYVWNPTVSNNADATGLDDGTYLVTVSDVNLCSVSLNFELNDPECNASYNLNENSITHCSTFLTWADVSDGLGYYLRYREVGEPEWIEITTVDSEYYLTGLLPETDYEWEVATICNQAESAYVGSSFTTGVLGNVTVNACKGIFTDTGGVDDIYGNDEDYTFTINPVGADKITVCFYNLDLEADYDTLFVYDGINTSSPLLVSYQDTIVGTSVSTKGLCIHSTGDALTFYFKSDYLTTNTGWYAEWTSYGSSCGIEPETEVNAILDNGWGIEDFDAEFIDDDYSGYGFTDKFWQTLYLNENDWIAPTDLGMLNDNFNTNATNWTNIASTWNVVSEHLTQTDEANDNTNLYIPINNDNQTILINWQMNIDGTGTNRRAGLHFMCDDATLSNRNNSYMVYYRPDQNAVQLYKYENNVMYLKTYDIVNIDVATWYNCAVYYNPTSGLIQAFLNGELVSSWIDDTPILTGNSLSLRTGNCQAQYDDIKVFTARTENETVSVSLNLMNTQNPDPLTPACKIKSIVMDGLSHFSLLEGSEVDVDITIPSDVSSVNDGLSTDVSIFTEELISANWQHATDPNSDVSHYQIAVGTAVDTYNIYEWSDIPYDDNYTISDITLFSDGVTYYVGVRAVNYAGLVGNAIYTDGQTYVAPAVAGYNPDETQICQNEQVYFTNNSVNGTSYFWEFEGGTPATSTDFEPTVTFPTAGDFDVKLVTYGVTGNDSLILEELIHVEAHPVASFTYSGVVSTLPTNFTNTSINANSFSWDFGDESLSEEVNPWHIYSLEGTYHIILTAYNENCPEDIDEQDIIISFYSSIQSNFTDLITLSPNPNNGQFKLILSKQTEDIVEVYDAIGKLIYESKLHGNSLNIDLTDVKSGLYFLKLRNSDISIQFVKED